MTAEAAVASLAARSSGDVRTRLSSAMPSAEGVPLTGDDVAMRVFVDVPEQVVCDRSRNRPQGSECQLDAPREAFDVHRTVVALENDDLVV